MKAIYLLLIYSLILFVRCTIDQETMRCIKKTLKLENGNMITYTECGSGDALVFIHAGGLDSEMWEKQTTFFNENHKVIAYDIRGHGSSTFVKNEDYEIDDIGQILDNEKIDSLSIVGCSLGAIIALDFAINQPNLVKKLVLISPGLIGLQEKDSLFLEQMNDYIQAFQANDQEAMISQLKVLNAIGTKARELPDELNFHIHNKIHNHIKNPGLTRVPVIKTINPIDTLASITTKTLLITGEWDHHYIHENAKHLHKHLQRGSIEVIKEAGHLPNMEKPNEINKIINQFLTD